MKNIKKILILLIIFIYFISTYNIYAEGSSTSFPIGGHSVKSNTKIAETPSLGGGKSSGFAGQAYFARLVQYKDGKKTYIGNTLLFYSSDFLNSAAVGITSKLNVGSPTVSPVDVDNKSTCVKTEITYGYSETLTVYDGAIYSYYPNTKPINFSSILREVGIEKIDDISRLGDNSETVGKIAEYVTKMAIGCGNGGTISCQLGITNGKEIQQNLKEYYVQIEPATRMNGSGKEENKISNGTPANQYVTGDTTAPGYGEMAVRDVIEGAGNVADTKPVTTTKNNQLKDTIPEDTDDITYNCVSNPNCPTYGAGSNCCTSDGYTGDYETRYNVPANKTVCEKTCTEPSYTTVLGVKFYNLYEKASYDLCLNSKKGKDCSTEKVCVKDSSAHKCNECAKKAYKCSEVKCDTWGTNSAFKVMTIYNHGGTSTIYPAIVTENAALNSRIVEITLNNNFCNDIKCENFDSTGKIIANACTAHHVCDEVVDPNTGKVINVLNESAGTEHYVGPSYNDAIAGVNKSGDNKFGKKDSSGNFITYKLYDKSSNPFDGNWQALQKQGYAIGITLYWAPTSLTTTCSDSCAAFDKKSDEYLKCAENYCDNMIGYQETDNARLKKAKCISNICEYKFTPDDCDNVSNTSTNSGVPVELREKFKKLTTFTNTEGKTKCNVYQPVNTTKTNVTNLTGLSNASEYGFCVDDGIKVDPDTSGGFNTIVDQKKFVNIACIEESGTLHTDISNTALKPGELLNYLSTLKGVKTCSIWFDMESWKYAYATYHSKDMVVVSKSGGGTAEISPRQILKDELNEFNDLLNINSKKKNFGFELADCIVKNGKCTFNQDSGMFKIDILDYSLGDETNPRISAKVKITETMDGKVVVNNSEDKNKEYELSPKSKNVTTEKSISKVNNTTKLVDSGNTIFASNIYSSISSANIDYQMDKYCTIDDGTGRVEKDSTSTCYSAISKNSSEIKKLEAKNGYYTYLGRLGAKYTNYEIKSSDSIIKIEKENINEGRVKTFGTSVDGNAYFKNTEECSKNNELACKIIVLKAGNNTSSNSAYNCGGKYYTRDNVFNSNDTIEYELKMTNPYMAEPGYTTQYGISLDKNNILNGNITLTQNGLNSGNGSVSSQKIYGEVEVTQNGSTDKITAKCEIQSNFTNYGNKCNVISSSTDASTKTISFVVNGEYNKYNTTQLIANGFAYATIKPESGKTTFTFKYEDENMYKTQAIILSNGSNSCNITFDPTICPDIDEIIPCEDDSSTECDKDKIIKEIITVGCTEDPKKEGSYISYCKTNYRDHFTSYEACINEFKKYCTKLADDYVFRIVDTQNPFPYSYESPELEGQTFENKSRQIGLNWVGVVDLIREETTGKKYLIKLDPSTIKKIREDNKISAEDGSNPYSDISKNYRSDNSPDYDYESEFLHQYEGIIDIIE